MYPCPINTLAPLPLPMPGAIQSRALWRVLVCAAASHLAVPPACAQLDRAPSGPTVLGTLADQRGDLEALAGQGNHRLARRLPHGLGKRGRRIAIDGIARPSHGTVAAPHHDDVCRRKAKGGTTHFFPSATASAVLRGRRSTLALCRVRAKQPMEHVVRTLLARLVPWGLRMRRLWLDRGFSRVRGMRDRITGALPGLMPAVTRGTTPTTPGGPTGTYALAAKKQDRWPSYTLHSPHEGPLELDLAVVCHHTRGQRGRHQREARLSATWGVTPRPLRWMRATSRSRLGFEASYRQVHQARMRPRSRTPIWRLLFVGVALILRHIWGWLPAEVLAEPRRGGQHLPPESRRFARLLLWLLLEVATHDRLVRKVPVYRDLYERAQDFGIVFNY